MPTKQQQSIADIYPAARKAADEAGVYVELMLAQVADDAGWGEKVLNGSSNLSTSRQTPAGTAIRKP